MTRAMTLTNDRLGPYVLAFVVGAAAISSLARKPGGKPADGAGETDEAIAEKLVDRLARSYSAALSARAR